LKERLRKRDSTLLLLKYEGQKIQGAAGDFMTETRAVAEEHIRQAKQTLSEKFGDLAHRLNPQASIQKNPLWWGLGALAVGALSASLVKTLLAGRAGLAKTQPPAPEPAPVEEAASVNSIQPGQTSEAMLKPLLDALLPVAVEYVRRVLRLDQPPPLRAEPGSASRAVEEAAAAQTARLSPSISRRTAPPPLES
jgi:hypothetical protein